MFNKKFYIGEVCIEINADKDICNEDRYLLFENKMSGKADIFIKFKSVDEIPVYQENNLVRDPNCFFEEYKTDEKYVRVFNHMYTGERYAVLIEKNKKLLECYYLKNNSKAFQDISGLFGHIAFERLMIENNVLLFHAALVKYNGKGILFSGPSGIGKSTQAYLWEKYEKAEIINGDKVLIRKKDDKCYGYGSPFAGSSNTYKNKKVKLDAVVFLDRADEHCIINSIYGAEAFKKILSETIQNSWNKEYMLKVIDFIKDITENINIFYMYALKDVESVKALKNVIDNIE